MTAAQTISLPKSPSLPIKPAATTISSNHLPTRLSIDLFSALLASTLVAPVITLIDKSIIQRTSSPSTPLRTLLTASLRSALYRPFSFLTSTPYLLITGLYFATYTAANVSDTVASVSRDGSYAHVGSGWGKFGATTSVNMSACLYKDARFAKMFGATAGASSSTSKSGSSTSASGSTVKAAAKRVVPRSSLALFAARDSLTVFASFNVPSLLGPLLSEAGGLGAQAGLNAAQFLAPAGVQAVSTPLHLLGLDLYNRQKGAGGEISGGDGRINWRDRWTVVRRDWFGASLARMARVVPAFGVGGVVNSKVRRTFMGRLDEKRGIVER